AAAGNTAGLAMQIAFITVLAVGGARVATGAIPPEAGIRADRAPDGSGWHIEVRCVLAEGHRALDTAQNVHDRVRTAVTSHLATHGVAEPVTVAVTVTRIAADVASRVFERR
ncbi:hypothetical protein ABZ504_47015, partial [Streptomyces mirabilis]|uniref:hypothetical protein n=1 Tax=Streptomyces mirabilis TaxID=68239 RepID=UPI0033E06F1A